MCSPENNSISLVSLLLAFTVCMQNPVWIFWNGGVLLGYFSVFLLYLVKRKNLRYYFDIYAFILLSFMLLVFIFIPAIYTFRISSLFIVLSYFLALSIDCCEGKKALDIITKFLYWVILISLPPWLIHLYGYEFPLFNQLDLSEMKGSTYIYNNYILFLTVDGLDFFRFYSLFDEPGVLGTLSSFILYGNRYDFKKKENVVILIGCLFTYSMAFYVITLLGWLYQSTRSFKKFVLTSGVIILLVQVSLYLMIDDQAFQQSVVERFSDIGLNQVERRSGSYLNVFWDKFVVSNDFLFGMGTSFITENIWDIGCSYKTFVIEYGLLGTVLLIMMYIHLVKRWNYLIFGFVVLFFLSFLQRPYAFTSWQIFVFVVVISNLYIDPFAKRNV